MTKPIALLTTLLLTGLLAACGNSETPDSGAEASETNTPAEAPASGAASDDATSWTIRLTGAESLDIEIEPRFGCSNEQIHILTMSQAPRFDLYLPASIEPGTYPLAQFDANADPAFVAGHGVVSVSGNRVPGSGSGYGTFYFQPRGGEITIERMPGSPGEFFTASIEATLASRDDETIELDAALNLQASGMMMMNCQL